MRLLRLLQEGTIAIVIPLALLAGLAASYGRELYAGQRPGRIWWISRLLVLPILAIAAAAATNLLGLSPSAAAFTAAMLSLGGYDVLRLFEARWRARLETLAASPQPPPAGPGEPQ